MFVRIKQGIKPLARYGGAVVTADPMHNGMVIVTDRDPLIKDTILWPDEYEIVPVAKTRIRQELYLGCGRAVLVRETEISIDY